MLVLLLVDSVEASVTEVDSVVVSEAVIAVDSVGVPVVSVVVTEVDSVVVTEAASVEHHVADTEVSLY